MDYRLFLGDTKMTIKRRVLGKNDKVVLYTGNSLSVLRTLNADFIQCCITSPPYYQLRDYGTARWEGGDLSCNHTVGNQVPDTKNPNAIKSGIRPGCDASTCKLCGARRIDDQIGLEQTPEEYIEKLVKVFREVKRVLRPDGTLWVNIADSYAGSSKGRGSDGQINYGLSEKQISHTGSHQDKLVPQKLKGYKPKDLIGIPWMLAFALRADGWYLRSDTLWNKVNALPEPVLDRPTRSHEYVFLLSKSRRYFYDSEAVRVASSSPKPIINTNHTTSASIFGDTLTDSQSNSEKLSESPDGKVNLRSIWSIPTQSFREAHYAVYPEKLVENCLKAGTSEHGCCSQCGVPYSRILDKKSISRDELPKDHPDFRPTRYDRKSKDNTYSNGGGQRLISSRTTGWKAGCSCENSKIVPCVVLDPFNGAATTGLVAIKNGRKYIGVDLNPEFIKISDTRLRKIACQTTLF
jgi:DNA modification methylase